MIVVDGKTIPIKCSYEVYIAKRTVNIYLNGYHLFVNLVDVFSKMILGKRYMQFYSRLKNLSKAILDMKKCLGYVDAMYSSICDRIYSAKKFKVGNYEIDWNVVFNKLEIEVLETKDYISLAESLYKSTISYAYKVFFEFKGNRLSYDEAILKILDKIEWICKWSMNVATVVSNALISISFTLYNVVNKVLEMYYSGSISEKSMSYAIADIDDRLTEIYNYVGRLSEIRWMFRYSYVYVKQFRELVEG